MNKFVRLNAKSVRSNILPYARLFIFIFLCLNFTTNLGAQEEEWEIVDISKLSWRMSSDVSVYTNTPYHLSIANKVAETKEDKKNNRWHYESASLDIVWNETRKYEISFRIQNNNNKPSSYKYKVYEKTKKGKLKEEWHNKDIYWGFIISVNNSSGGTSTFYQYYSDRKTYNRSYTYTDARNSEQDWGPCVDLAIRTVKIVYDGSNILLYAGKGETLIKTFHNAKSVACIKIVAGTAANVEVTNVQFKRQTDYGRVKPLIEKAQNELEKEEFATASRTLTDVIDSYNYKNAFVYTLRAWAYASLDLYQSAIADCTTALTYDSTYEHAYYIRGICKIGLNDDTGVTDLRKAGQEGIVLLREYGLYDYYPSNKQSQQNSRNRGINNRHPNQRKMLKKDPNFKID